MDYVRFIHKDNISKISVMPVSTKTKQDATDLEAAGYSFQFEKLDGNVLHLACVIVSSSQVLTHDMVLDGPGVPGAIERLIATAAALHRARVTMREKTHEPI